MKRKCAECPAEVQAVCRHAFGKFWNGKNGNGIGCNAPMDDVAKKWHAKGWTPGMYSFPNALPRMPRRPKRFVQDKFV